MAPAVGDDVAGEHVLAGDFALLDLGDAAFGDAYAVADLLLPQPSAAADLGEPACGDSREQFLLARLAE
ncbi:hypothetical protein FB565_006765 [Actinoplanes lutulentus]|nr:hypothetical protein [Actinoplanes lutulentus]